MTGRQEEALSEPAPSDDPYRPHALTRPRRANNLVIDPPHHLAEEERPEGSPLI